MNYLFNFLFIISTTLVSCTSTSSNTSHEKKKLEKKNLQKPTNLSEAAISIINDDIQYDPTYFNIGYPNGDIPADRGVCTDVVIRSYRKLGIDLQKEVHEDMKAHFQSYPKIWGLTSTDKNIDHRRVPNLKVFFSRKGKSLPISLDSKEYLPGDIVTWVFSNGLTHIGVVVKPKSSDKKRHLIVHNVGNGQVMEDVLFEYKITGHYRYKIVKE